jgi:monovalent cation/hydrogen antiporter
MVLNVLAFTLIGLQIGPILEGVDASERLHLLGAALAMLVVVILIRLAWTFTYDLIVRLKARLSRDRRQQSEITTPSAGGALVVGWSGMRGIVTLATSLALPADFPYRDFIQLTAFVVVLGTLLLQGLTLRPLLKLARLPKEDIVGRELSRARQTALQAALVELEGETTPAARRLSQEYQDALAQALSGGDPLDTPDNALRRRMVLAARQAIEGLRSSSSIGDEAYRRVEEELDLMELSAQQAETRD